ncbi:MAG: hypothetical protein WD066_12160 [Planctomycetaceae bacterium]
MPEKLVECEFPIPIVRDSHLSDGRRHSVTTWRWFERELWVRFGGATVAMVDGFYADSDTGE